MKWIYCLIKYHRPRKATKVDGAYSDSDTLFWFLNSEICKYIEKILQCEVPGCSVYCGGSFPLKVYLPESDLDIVVFLPNTDDMSVVLKVFCGLCAEIQRSDTKAVAESMFRIKNFEFVNARVKLAHCLVNNMHIDIAINQKSSLASAIFLNEVDNIIGHRHLFKRSILLVKVVSYITNSIPTSCYCRHGACMRASDTAVFPSLDPNLACCRRMLCLCLSCTYLISTPPSRTLFMCCAASY